MDLEYLDLEARKDAWRKAVEKSVHKMSNDELNALWENLFPDTSHPWSERFRRFIEENAGGAFYHATTIDRIQFVYCQAKEKGIWFIRDSAIGIMQPTALNAMREIIGAR